MNHIVRRKNDGYLIIEVLNSYEELNDGDQYVYLGRKNNSVIQVTNRRTSITRVGRVIWDYGVRNRKFVIVKYF